MTPPYAPPRAGEARALFVVRAYRVYAAMMCVGYVVLAVAFVSVLPVAHPVPCATAAAGFALLYGVALFAPREPWAWTLGLVAIGVGMTGVGIVFAIPLLMAWRRPTTKAAYRRLP